MLANRCKHQKYGGEIKKQHRNIHLGNLDFVKESHKNDQNHQLKIQLRA